MIHAPTAGPITSPFGPRRSVQDRATIRQHNGVDLGGELGAPVYAMADGLVEVVTPNGAAGFNCYGRVVVIHHAGFGELRSLSAHLLSTSVRTNQVVRAGDVIAQLGNSNGSEWAPGTTFADGDCQSTGRRFRQRPGGAPRAHLHLELRDGEYPTRYTAPRIDPIRWLGDHGVPYTANERGGRPVRLQSEPEPAGEAGIAPVVITASPSRARTTRGLSIVDLLPFGVLGILIAAAEGLR